MTEKGDGTLPPLGQDGGIGKEGGRGPRGTNLWGCGDFPDTIWVVDVQTISVSLTSACLCFSMAFSSDREIVLYTRLSLLKQSNSTGWEVEHPCVC